MVAGFVKTAMTTAIGKSAIELNAKDINGKPISLAEFRGKIVLIDFWASWCGPCRLKNKDALKVYKTYAPKGFEIVGIAQNRNIQGKVLPFSRTSGMWHL